MNRKKLDPEVKSFYNKSMSNMNDLYVELQHKALDETSGLVDELNKIFDSCDDEKVKVSIRSRISRINKDKSDLTFALKQQETLGLDSGKSRLIAKNFRDSVKPTTGGTAMAESRISKSERPQTSVSNPEGKNLQYGDFLKIERRSRSKKRRTALENSVKEYWSEETEWSMVRGAGWFAVPKFIPIMMSLLDENAPRGIKLGSTYLALLSMTWEGVPVIDIKDEAELALLAGFGGKNRKYALRDRLAILEEMGMIRVLGTQGEWQKVFIREPIKAWAELEDAGKVDKTSTWAMFFKHFLAYRAS